MVSDAPVRDGRGGNWWWAHNAVLDRYGPELGPYGIAVYVCLCRHAGQDGETWAGQKTVGDQTGCSVRQVRRELDKLAALRLIRVEERRDGRGRLTNRYVLLQPEEADPTERTPWPVPPDSVAGTPGLPGRASPDCVAGAMMINKTQLTRPKEQEAAGGVHPTAEAIAPAAPAAAGAGTIEECAGEDAATNDGDDGREQELLAALGAARSPANVRAMAAVVAAYPALDHRQQAAVCAAYYAEHERPPPGVARYAEWCKRDRGGGTENGAHQQAAGGVGAGGHRRARPGDPGREPPIAQHLAHARGLSW